jgi:hypothetical protein
MPFGFDLSFHRNCRKRKGVVTPAKGDIWAWSPVPKNVVVTPFTGLWDTYLCRGEEFNNLFERWVENKAERIGGGTQKADGSRIQISIQF